jgi:hypothetical protein
MCRLRPLFSASATLLPNAWDPTPDLVQPVDDESQSNGWRLFLAFDHEKSLAV